jgi:integrase/recombinase XerD
MSSLSLNLLFDQFCKERQYVKNSSPHTILFYQASFKKFTVILGDDIDLTKNHLNRFILGMREKGLKPETCNVHIRGMNSFLSWLFENEFISEHLKMKQLKTEQRIMKTFSDNQLKAIFLFKPKTFSEARLHTLLCLVMDTGVRISEALDLRRDKVDFDNLLLTVRGKGNKERPVPMSLELRKVLWKFSQKHKFELMFPNSYGGRLRYDNTRRDFKKLCQKLKLDGFDGSFHAFRRKFARSYVKNGGNLFYLMKALGHTTLAMSKKYVEVETEDLKDMHFKVSILSHVR